MSSQMFKYIKNEVKQKHYKNKEIYELMSVVFCVY